MEHRKPYTGTCEECGNNRDGLCRMNGLRYTLPESGRCDHGHYKAEKKCPVCGQSVSAEKTLRAIAAAMVKHREQCNIYSPVCDDNCRDRCACEYICPLRKYTDGSNFRYGGTA